MKALIVDDQPNVRLLLSRILRRKIGCTVTEATNGLEALDLLGRQPFDLVVLDVLMPVMDGLETLEAMRRMPSLRNLPVVVLSAVRDEGKVRQLVRHGIAAYLAKPLRPMDVADRIQAIMTRLAVTQGQPSRSLSAVQRGSRVLVVDGDPGFRRVVRDALSDYSVSEAAAGAEGLRICLQQRPALVIVGQDLGVIGPAVLMRKLRALPDLAAVRVVAAVAGDVAAPADADATMRRTLAPESFRQQFARMVIDQPPELHVLSTRQDLRPQMVAATEQVFGMMLGLEVMGAPATDTPAVGDDIVRIALTLEREQCDLEFAFAAPRSMSERMTALFLHAGDVVTDADVSATLCEMATIIGGRLQTALRHRGDAVALGEPAVSRVVADDPLPTAALCVTFASAARDLRFMTTLRAVPRSDHTQDVAAHTSRSPMESPIVPPPVDPEVIEMLASLQEPGEPDLVVELVTLFLRDTPERLAELTRSPLEAGHVARVAHAIKGSAGNLGATALQDLAGQLEQAGHRGESVASLAALGEAVHAEYARVDSHLRGVLVERAGADSALQSS